MGAKTMKRGVLSALACVLSAWAAPSWAQISNDTVKIGVATDLSSLYADINGPGAIVATEMAIADFGGTVLGKKIELVSGDIQNKADVAASLAGRWYDAEHVDMIMGAGASSSSIAIEGVAGQKKKIFLAPDPASSDITGKLCNPYTVHWVYDTAALANGTGSAVVKSGGKTWFFLTADYAFGYALQRDVAAVVTKAGGKVLGEVRHPINTSDFSSYLLQAQASKAQIIGLANAGGDTINAIKQGAEFGIVKGGQKFAGLLVFASDIAALGLQTAQGLTLTETWYWDANDTNRAWTKRWQQERGTGTSKWPTMIHAGVYASILHYLKAVEAIKSAADGKAVVAEMKKLPTDDPLFGKGTIRADGRKIHDAYLYEVKKPSESKHPGDFYNLKATIPASEAFRPLKDGGCPLVNG
jgi:branched-chain amino acid transport system substrate-binding protein